MSTCSLESMRLVERLCSRFEESHDPAAQDLESVVDPLLDGVAPQDRGVLLGELLAIDAELRRRQGATISPTDYQPFVLRTDLSFTANDARRIVDAAQASLPDVPTSERYRFLAKVGSGGNGDVWRVDDRVGQRTLAVKRLRDSHHEDAAAEARLIREALLTGRLQHPGIPPIYDHGRLDDGAAFFSMKLVEGETFEKILKSRSREDDDPIRTLGIFEQVTQAVAYAHAEGVIHRDLKPQNIMVGAFGEVQVMDWGMAKSRSETSAGKINANQKPTSSQPISLSDTVPASDDESWDELARSLTMAGDILGTPAYMSPEQARGQGKSFDPRGDVFTLGSILFEILTHSRLHEGCSVVEAVRRAAAGDLKDARRRLDDCGADNELIAICERCLQLAPEDRYADAGEVSREITRHLASVESRARQAAIEQRELTVRAAEDQKRRRLQTQTAIAIAMVALVGAGVAGVLYRQAAASNQAALAAKTLADERLRQAQSIVDEYLTEVADEDGVLARTAGAQEVRRILLNKARRYYEDFVAQSDGDPAVRRGAAEAHARLAQIALVLDPGGGELFEQSAVAISIYDGLLADGPPSAVDLEGKAKAMMSMGMAHKISQQFRPASQHFGDAIAVLQRLVELRGSLPDRLLLADALQGRGNALSNLNRLDEAEADLIAAVRAADQLLPEIQNDAKGLRRIIQIYNSAGNHFGFKRGQWQQSYEHYRKACDACEQTLTLDPEHFAYQSGFASQRMNLGISLHVLRRYDESQEALRSAVEVCKEVLAANPSVVEFQRRLANGHINMGTFCFKQGMVDESVTEFRSAVQTLRRLFANQPDTVEHGVELMDKLGCYAFVTAEAKSIAGESVEEAVDDLLAEIRQLGEALVTAAPESTRFKSLQALWLGIDPDANPQQLMELTAGVESELGDQGKLDKTAVAARGLALYRSGLIDQATEFLKRHRSEGWREVTWLVDCLVRVRSDSEAAAQSLARGEKQIARKDPSSFLAFALRAEAERELARVQDRRPDTRTEADPKVPSATVFP